MTDRRRRRVRAVREDAVDAVNLGAIVDNVTESTMQVIMRQGRGRISDPRAVRDGVRDAVRRGLRDIRDVGLDDIETSEATVPSTVKAELPPSYSSGPVVVRPRQACEMLSIGLTKLYALLAEGALESYLHGGTRRITIASLHAYVQRQIAVTKMR